MHRHCMPLNNFLLYMSPEDDWTVCAFCARTSFADIKNIRKEIAEIIFEFMV